MLAYVFVLDLSYALWRCIVSKRPLNWMLKGVDWSTCCFTSTETLGWLGTGGQDGHLDSHTAPELSLEGVSAQDYISVTIIPSYTQAIIRK